MVETPLHAYAFREAFTIAMFIVVVLMFHREQKWWSKTLGRVLRMVETQNKRIEQLELRVRPDDADWWKDE